MSEPTRFLTGTLENWDVDPNYPMLWGDVYGNPKFEEGETVHTSYISRYQLEDLKEGVVVETTYSTYLLGKPFEKMVEEGLHNER
jgi:hypothetical protein